VWTTCPRLLRIVAWSQVQSSTVALPCQRRQCNYFLCTCGCQFPYHWYNAWYWHWHYGGSVPSVLWHYWLGVRKIIRPVKNYDEVLAWLSVWGKVQMICMWFSWCHCHPIISCFIIIQIGLTFLVPAYPGCPGKEAVKRVSDCAAQVISSLWFLLF